MITPEFLNTIVKATEEKAAKLNEYLINRIAERIAAAFYRDGTTEIIPASINDLHKMTSKGLKLEDIEKAVQQARPEIATEIHNAFMESAGEIAAYNTDIAKKAVKFANDNGELYNVKVPEYKRVGIPKNPKDLNMTAGEIRQLEAAYRRTKGTVNNLTRTAGVSANNAYIEACDNAYFKIKGGTGVSQAITEAINEVAQQGITVVTYGGRKERIEVAIARAVRTGINQANAEIVLSRCAEMGVNYVKVSQHMGARVTDENDYTNHSYWQGKVYKIDWSSPVLSEYSARANENTRGFGWLTKIKDFFNKLTGKEYPDFIESTGYGNILGLCGVNCRHTFSAYYPDFMKNNEKPIDPKENERRYREEQRARAMERAIRKTKRQISALRASGVNTKEVEDEIERLSMVLKGQLYEYHNYMTKHHLAEDNYRLVTA